MAQQFSDDYYNENDEELQEYYDSIKDKELIEDPTIDPTNAELLYADDYDEENYPIEDDGAAGEEGEMDEEQLEKEKQQINSLRNELYSLDYEDIVAGIPCRFKYKQVEPDAYGLETEEILLADDNELNRYVSLKYLSPYNYKQWGKKKGKKEGGSHVGADKEIEKKRKKLRKSIKEKLNELEPDQEEEKQQLKKKAGGGGKEEQEPLSKKRNKQMEEKNEEEADGTEKHKRKRRKRKGGSSNTIEENHDAMEEDGGNEVEESHEGTPANLSISQKIEEDIPDKKASENGHSDLHQNKPKNKHFREKKKKNVKKKEETDPLKRRLNLYK
jgi:hypothetical protein